MVAGSNDSAGKNTSGKGNSGKNSDQKERRSDETTPKLRSKKVNAEQEKELLEKAGFTSRDIYNRRGWLDSKGLATVMEAGDSIVEVMDDHVVLKTPSGIKQTFWNKKKDLPFLRHLREKQKD